MHTRVRQTILFILSALQTFPVPYVKIFPILRLLKWSRFARKSGILYHRTRAESGLIFRNDARQWHGVWRKELLRAPYLYFKNSCYTGEDILVLIANASSVYSDKSESVAACHHKAVMWLKAQLTIQTSCPTGLQSTHV